MRRPNQTIRDESIAGKWADLRQYEEGVETTHGRDLQENEGDGGTLREALSTRARLQQLKKNSSKRFASIKTQLSGIVLKSSKERKGRGEVKDGNDLNGVSSSPMGEDSSQSQPGCGSLNSISTLGGRLRTSKSLQNLEQATKDGMRAVVDKTSYTASSMKHRYGSRLELTGKLTGKYDKFKDDPESDEENFRPSAVEDSNAHF